MAAANPPAKDAAIVRAGASSASSPQSLTSTGSNKAIKRILIFLCFIAAFVLGVHFGGGAYLRKQGYGGGGHADGYIPLYSDAIQEFVERDLLPTVNQTLAAFMATDETTAEKKTSLLRPGERFKKQFADSGRAIGPKYPVFFVPGFITGGLQLWSGEECLKHRFRDSIWGSTSMATGKGRNLISYAKCCVSDDLNILIPTA